MTSTVQLAFIIHLLTTIFVNDLLWCEGAYFYRVLVLSIKEDFPHQLPSIFALEIFHAKIQIVTIFTLF